MKRLDDVTVELTDAELEAGDFMDSALDLGYSIPKAVAYTRARYARDERVTEEFYDYLRHYSDDLRKELLQLEETEYQGLKSQAGKGVVP